MDIWWQEMASMQYAEMHHMEIWHWQSNFASKSSPNGGTPEKKSNIQGDIRMLLGRNCEVENMIRFLRM